MLKTIDGLEYIEGTGKGSLYPVCLWHKSGLRLGLQFKFRTDKGSGLMQVCGYARVAQFDDNNKAVIPDLSDVYEFIRRTPLTVASRRHLSGDVAAVAIPLGNLTDPMKDGDSLGKLYVDIVKRLKKAGTSTKLKDEYLHKVGCQMYWDHIGFKPVSDEDIPDVEDQLSDDFDFLSMLGSPSDSKD